MKKTPFYASGLKFSCKRCSACCRYEAGFVFLTEKDKDSLAAELKMDISSFISAYCRWVVDWKGELILSLREKSNKDCILWDNGCTVYSARPVQCVAFPFWRSVLSSAEAWEIAASGCPGMNQGELYTQEEIEERIDLRGELQYVSRSKENAGEES